MIEGRTYKQMNRLDYAFHVCRHLTAARAQGVKERLSARLGEAKTKYKVNKSDDKKENEEMQPTRQ